MLFMLQLLTLLSPVFFVDTTLRLVLPYSRFPLSLKDKIDRAVAIIFPINI